MKTIGFIVGKDRVLADTLIEKLNSIGKKEYDAKLISAGGIRYQEQLDYDVIFDTGSVYLPFLQTYMMSAARSISKIINKNLYLHPNNHIYYIATANDLGINTPNVMALPSKEHPYGVAAEYMQNIEYPLNWDNIFSKFVIPILVKKNYYYPYEQCTVIFSQKEFFEIYDRSGSDILVLQEVIDFDDYYIVYTVGKEQIYIKYDPFGNTIYEKFKPNEEVNLNKALEKKIKQNINKFNKAIGAEVNAIEVGIKDDVPFLTQFNNHHLITNPDLIGEDNFNTVSEKILNLLIS